MSKCVRRHSLPALPLLCCSLRLRYNLRQHNAFWPKIRHRHIVDIVSLCYNMIRICVRVCMKNTRNINHSHFLFLYEHFDVVSRMLFVNSENEEFSRHESCTQWALFSRTPYKLRPWTRTSLSRSLLHMLLLWSLLLWSLRFIAPLSLSLLPLYPPLLHRAVLFTGESIEAPKCRERQ